MSDVTTVRAILRSVVNGPAWHGPSVKDALTNVTTEDVSAHPVPEAHSIWELVLHMTAWQDYALCALGGETVTTLTGEDDWPPVTDYSEAAWNAALEAFYQGHQKLDELLSDYDEDRLGTHVPGHSHSRKVMLHGLAMHHVYHAGQIALLRKVLTGG